jgi:hypothetical protein
MADNDIQGSFDALYRLFLSPVWREVWDGLNYTVQTFESLELSRRATDWVVWETCQSRQVILVTGNRNQEAPDSLEAAIRTLNGPTSLPVITLSRPRRILESTSYRHRTAEKLLEYLIEMDKHLGAGRLYVP